MLAIARCSQSHFLLKIYREVLTIIIGAEYRRWSPTEHLCKAIQ